MMDQVTGIETAEPRWKALYRIGAVAPLITLAFYLTEILVMFSGVPYPVTVADWFSLFQRNRILGLLYLNALDIFSIALLGTMFLALYVALRRANESYMAVAAFFAFIGVAVFIASRVPTLAVLPLSDQYAAATTEAQRSQILAAGRALNALGTATPQTMGFFFMAVAVLFISAVMLRFSSVTAYVGILTGIMTVADDISVVLAPSVAAILMPISGALWIIWWIMISRVLFRLGRPERETLPEQSQERPSG